MIQRWGLRPERPVRRNRVLERSDRDSVTSPACICRGPFHRGPASTRAADRRCIEVPEAASRGPTQCHPESSRAHFAAPRSDRERTGVWPAASSRPDGRRTLRRPASCSNKSREFAFFVFSVRTGFQPRKFFFKRRDALPQDFNAFRRHAAAAGFLRRFLQGLASIRALPYRRA